MTPRLAVVGFAISCLVFNGAVAQETIAIPSFTPASPAAFLKHEGAAVTVTGSLYLPAGISGRLPAVILKHGSGGLVGPTGTNIRGWAVQIASWGVAALVVDSFGPRKITGTSNSQGVLSPWAEVADSFAALKVLAADARIDRTRIGIMGWSRGGLSAMNTTLEAARKAAAVGADVKFAAHIVFYGSGLTQYRDTATDKSPFLFIHGEADNYIPIGPTREYAAWVKTMGNPVTFVSYPGALHNFDIETAVQGFSPAVEVTSCDFVYNLTDQRILRMDHKPNPVLKPGDIPAYQKACLTHGANIGFDAKARADAIEAVRSFLKQTLRASG
jgi:dienelactone hydrolase